MAGHLRHPPRALPRARALERQRPDPQGAHVRPHRAAGQPRRGRQGVLVVPRGAAEPRAAEVALPLPAGRVPVRRSSSHHGRGLHDPELELLDTGVFDDDRYWSVDVTYAKASPTEVLMRIELENHGPDEATLDVLPTLWFRNTWSWDDGAHAAADRAATARRSSSPTTASPATGSRPRPARTARRPRRSSARTRRTRRASSARTPTTPYPKDGINDHVVSGAATVNPDGFGTKAALRYRVTVPAGGKAELRLRLHRPASRDAAGGDAGRPTRSTRSSPRARPTPTSSTRRSRRTAPTPSAMRVAAPGVRRAGVEQADVPVRRAPLARRRPRPSRRRPRRTGTAATRGWRHLDSFDVLAMPDPWEYPWFAAWDLGFHCVPWAHLDPAFAKYQLLVLLREWFQHPNGALPAYEWNFDDVNPPVHVHGRAARLRDRRRDATASSSSGSSRSCCSTSPGGSTARTPTATTSSAAASSASTTSARSTARTCPTGVTLEQADGTAWMAYYALSMLVIAIELAEENDVYDGHGGQVPRAVRARSRGRSSSRASTTPRTASSTTGSCYPSGESTAGEGADDRRA